MREILLRAFVIDTVLSLCRPSLSLSLPLSPLLCSPLLPLVSHSVPVVPPLHLPAGSEWKREENPLWIGVALFSSAFLLFGPLGSVVYWCSSGMARVEGCGGGGGGGGSVPLSQSKRFENKWGERKWIWKKKEGEGVAGLWKAREIKKKKEERDEEAVFWRVCGEHRSPLDSARVVFDPNFSHFVKRHFVKVRLGALSMSELGRAGNRLEAALTRQQQSVRTGMYIYTPTHTHTRTSIQAHTHTHTHKDARLIIQPSLSAHLPLVSKVIFFPSLLPLCLQFLPTSPRFPPRLFFLTSYLSLPVLHFVSCMLRSLDLSGLSCIPRHRFQSLECFL